MPAPPPLTFQDPVLDFAFHPTQPLIAVGLFDGHLHTYTYTDIETTSAFSIHPHRKSVRGVEFTPDGTGIYTISLDKSLHLIDSSTGNPIWTCRDAHSSALNVLHVLDAQHLSTGDEDGEIRIWDVRRPSSDGPVMKYEEHSDFISDMISRARLLLAASGDGHLSIWDIRKPDVVAMSDYQEDELLSLCEVKSGRKLVVGSQEGVLSLWSWGNWGDLTDRFLGHPGSIDCILKLDEDTVATGSMDGIIRVVGILPNVFHGVIGTHGEFPIERMSMAAGGRMMGSCGHDHCVRLWDVGFLFDEDGDEEEEKEEEEVEEEEEEDDDDDDADDDDEDDDDDDDDKEDERRAKAPKRPGREPYREGSDRKRRRRVGAEDEKRAFFESLD